MNSAEFNAHIAHIGEKDSFDAIFNYFFPRVVMHIRARYHNEELARDVAQEVFTILLTKPPVNVTYPTAYIMRFADNVAYDMAAKTLSPNCVPLEQAYSVADASSYTDSDELTQALNALEQEDRTLIILKIYEGYTLKEIACQLGINASTVRTQYRRALAKCQKIYQKLL